MTLSPPARNRETDQLAPRVAWRSILCGRNGESVSSVILRTSVISLDAMQTVAGCFVQFQFRGDRVAPSETEGEVYWDGPSWLSNANITMLRRSLRPLQETTICLSASVFTSDARCWLRIGVTHEGVFLFAPPRRTVCRISLAPILCRSGYSGPVGNF